MPFTVIAGRFAPEFGNPDGDSVRFVADDPGPIFRLRRRGRAPRINRTNGSIQLRYEGIDTMESRALTPFSSDATASNLEVLGAGGGAPLRGYICSTQLGPNGRPIAFLFLGDPPVADGGEVFLSADDIMQSVNVEQLARGHAYPLFYDTLFKELRERFTEVSLEAKAVGRGVWSADVSNSAVPWTGSVETLPPIFPKLWRRIDKYVRDETFFETDSPMAGLKPWLEAERDERVLVVSENRVTGFDNLVETTDTTVELLAEPHDMVIVSVQ